VQWTTVISLCAGSESVVGSVAQHPDRAGNDAAPHEERQADRQQQISQPSCHAIQATLAGDSYRHATTPMVNIQLTVCHRRTRSVDLIEVEPKSSQKWTTPRSFTFISLTAIRAAMARIKLTRKQRLALIAEYLAGARIDFLATKYGVHRSYPRQLFKRQAKIAQARLPEAA